MASLHLSLVEDQTSAERSRKTSLEQRAALVITTSGALVTLQLAMAALRTRTQTFAITSVSFDLSTAALALFVVAASLALFANLPAGQPIVSTKHLSDLAQHDWDEQNPNAVALKLYNTQTNILAELRKRNDCKARMLIGALTVEFMAIVLIAIAVALILTRR
ncbi:hypothetical protein [Streptomyces endophytica]|uniref:Uncharacterized protein n=1 Tax=Streptomyces endophytica TaxID=2991496 RepID=A0ABY6PI59_9ACTN|nr:hypothetical protein [Streptomyces endophytica]UZJ33501.1 hypothetical protein OJ254_28515 [Streptomyces endophytica]